MVHNKKFVYNEFEVWSTDALDNQFSRYGYTKNDTIELFKTLVQYVQSRPPKPKGNYIPKSGGAIKLHLAPQTVTKGRRESERLIYCYLNQKQFIFLAIYRKADKKDLTQQEIHALKHMMDSLKSLYQEV